MIRHFVPIALILAIPVISCASLDTLGNRRPTACAVINSGGTSTFEGGVLYRRPGHPPILVVSGTHYAMGRQYGALLAPELCAMVDSFKKIIRVVASDEGVPESLLVWHIQMKSGTLARKLPPRFREELRGISEGSGFDYNTVLMGSMVYDVLRMNQCTGIIARTAQGGIVHGRTQDFPFGMEIGDKTVIVTFKPRGYRPFTSVAWPGFLGAQTAMNESGLGYSENTLASRTTNSRGFSLNYLARMVMEECGSLADVKRLIDGYATINGEMLIISDRGNASGAVFESSPVDNPRWTMTTMRGPALWAVNRYINPHLAETAAVPFSQHSTINATREAILSNYFNNGGSYSERDIVAILRATGIPGGEDYKLSVIGSGISNPYTQQMVVFSPDGNGLYMATGKYHASKDRVWFYPLKADRAPRLFMKAEKLDAITRRVSEIIAGLEKKETIAERSDSLAGRYPNTHQVHMLAATAAWRAGRFEMWASHALEAYRLNPSIPEYAAEAAAALVRRGEERLAKTLLLGMDGAKHLSLKARVVRTALLTRILEHEKNPAASAYQAELTSICKDAASKRWLAKYFEIIFPAGH